MTGWLKEYGNWTKGLGRGDKALFLVLSVVGGGALSYGRLLSHRESLGNIDYKYIIYAAFCMVILYCFNVSAAIWLGMRTQTSCDEKKFRWNGCLLRALIVFLCWTPVFLAYYPTLWAYDVPGEVPIIIGEPYYNHHTLIHIL